MTDYFASKAGAGLADGTSAANAWAVGDIAWETVAQNTIYLLGTFTAKITVPSTASGVEGSPTEIRFDDPDSPGIITDKVTIGSWTATGVNGEYSIEDPRDVITTRIMVITRSGYPLNKSANGSNGSLDAGYYCLDVTTTPDTIYYKPPDGEAPTGVFVAGGIFTGLETDDTPAVDYIDFYGIATQYCNRGIRIKADGTDLPIAVNIYNAQMEHNISHIRYDAGVSCVVSGGTYRYCQTTGINLGYAGLTPGSTTTSWNGGKFINNVVEYGCYNDTVDQLEGHAIDVSPYTDGVLIRNNVFQYNSWWDGREWTGTGNDPATILSIDGAVNATVDRNKFYNNYAADVECGPDTNNAAATSNHYIRSNLFWNGGRDMDVSGEPAIACGVTVFAESASTDLGVFIENNVFYGLKGYGATGDREPAACITLNADATSGITGVSIQNNILYNNECTNDISYYSAGVTAMAITCKNNIIYRPSGGDYLMINTGTKKKYPETNDFPAWQIDFSDIGSQNVDPIINADLKPRIESPAKHAGTFIAADIYTFDGIRFSNPPSIGAYEYQSFITGSAIVTILGSGLM